MREIVINRITEMKLTSAYLRSIDEGKPLAKMTDDELLDAYDNLTQQKWVMETAERILHKIGDAKNESVDIRPSIPK